MILKKLNFLSITLVMQQVRFIPSPFENSIILTLDGVGEWATTTVAIGKGNDLKILKEIHFFTFTWVTLLKLSLIIQDSKLTVENIKLWV